MNLVNLRDLVETAAHKWYKENEKDSMKAKWGKTYNWKELIKEIDWRSLKFVNKQRNLFFSDEIIFKIEYVMNQLFIQIWINPVHQNIIFYFVQHFLMIQIVNKNII